MTPEPVPTLPLPPARAEEAPPAPAAEGRPRSPGPRPGVADGLFAVLVVALAVLLAATPIRNSDLWLHLAAGRAIAQRQAPFGAGTDPFASTTAGVRWANPAWLTDLALYALYAIGGGRALAVAKGVLVAVLAGLFFCFRRRGERTGVTALVAAAAVLALGPWLLLQPFLLSLLGVVLTLFLLERPALVAPERAGRARALRWLLLPLFAAWANLDAGFLLGPALVGLYALGAGLSRAWGEARALALLALAGLAACLLTPYHYHALTWPLPLGWSHAERALLHDPLGRGLVVSPFTTRFGMAPAFASPGGWAYCLLLLAGAASFAGAGRSLHLGRLLAWLALAALSIYQARAIPFFAVLSAPVLALNLRQVQTRRQGDRETRREPLLLVSLSPCLLVCLLVLAWPGWFQPAPYQPRAWAVEPDQSAAQLARWLATWHAGQPTAPAGCALTFSPEVAHYLAWFCPVEKGFLDSRWPLFDGVAEDYVRMRRCLLPAEGDRPDPQLGPLLDAYGINRILLYDPDGARTALAFRCLLRAPDDWELLTIEGGAAAFGQRIRGGPAAWRAFDWQRDAYHPAPEECAPRKAPPAPQPPGLLDAFWRAHEERPPDRAEAALDLVAADVLAERRQAERARQWLLAQAAGLAGLGPASSSAGTAVVLAVDLDLAPLPAAAERWAAAYLGAEEEGPPPALLRAVRAGRRALAADPDDAGALLLLGEAYLRLARQARAPYWQAALGDLAPLRDAQALTALEQAVLVRPDLDEAHARLAQLYYEQGQMDRALDHLQARLRIAERWQTRPGPVGRAAAERRAALEADVQKLAALVKQSEDVYAVNTRDLTDPSAVLSRARLAARHGLTRKALEMLLASHPAIFGKEGAQLQLDLMLRAGRAYEVRDWMEPAQEAVLGAGMYHSLRARAAAACGAYDEADAELDRLGDELRRIHLLPGQDVPVRPAVAFQVGHMVLAVPPAGAGPAAIAEAAVPQVEALPRLGSAAGMLRREAELAVLRGQLALEAGDMRAARDHCRAALAVWGDGPRAAAGAGLDFPARPIAQQALRRLDEAAR